MIKVQRIRFKRENASNFDAWLGILASHFDAWLGILASDFDAWMGVMMSDATGVTVTV